MQFQNSRGTHDILIGTRFYNVNANANVFDDARVQNVKAVFDAAIRVVLQPPKQKKKKSKAQKACSIL